MPFFGAIGQLRPTKNQKRNPLNRCCLMNGRLIVFHFSTATSTDDRGRGATAVFAITKEYVEKPSPLQAASACFSPTGPICARDRRTPWSRRRVSGPGGRPAPV